MLPTLRLQNVGGGVFGSHLFLCKNTYDFFFIVDDICTRLQQNNVFTVARRNVEGQELLYHSIKYTNQIYVLSELKMQEASQPLTVNIFKTFCLFIHYPRSISPKLLCSLSEITSFMM